MGEQSSDSPVLEAIAAMTEEAIARSDLDAGTLLTARIAALAAIDAPAVSYLVHIGPAVDAGITAKQVQGILIGIAPVIGGPRTMSAALKITEALGMVIVAAEQLEAGAAAR